MLRGILDIQNPKFVQILHAFNDKSLKFMFWLPMSEEISCNLQMRKANANGSFEQQAISCFSRVYHANNKRKQNNQKITNESNQT